MCGLFGFSGKTPCNKKYMQLGIIWNSLERGEDSTGIYSPINGLKKSLTKGSHYVLHDENDFKVDKIMIAHVRAKTVGSATVENAHPFERGNYILAHNGTLTNHRDLIHKYELDSSLYNVDSDVICGCIAKNNNFDVLKEIAGAAALLIHDKTNPELLYVFKNDQRPLWRGVDAKGNMYISSLCEPLYFMELFNVKEFKNDVIYTIKDGNIIKSIKVKNTPYNKPYVPAVNHNNYDYNNYNNNNSYNNYGNYNNVNNRYSLYENDGTYLNVWLRSKWQMSHESPDNNYSLVKDTYYLVLGKSTDQHRFRVMCNGVERCVPKGAFESSDLLQRNDLLVLLEDVPDGRGVFAGKNVGSKGDLFKVSTVYNDADVGICTIINEVSLGYIDKKYVRKLSEKELADYRIASTISHVTNIKYIEDIKNPIQLDLFNSTQDTTPLNSEPNNVADTNQSNNDEDYEAEMNAYNKSYDPMDMIEVDAAYLSEYFDESDNLLEEINELMSKDMYITPDLRGKVLELIDLNFIARYDIINEQVIKDAH